MVVAKTNYRIESSLEVFYTGGPAALFPDGDRLACACGDETKVLGGQGVCACRSKTCVNTHDGYFQPWQIIDLETGAVLRSLPGVGCALGQGSGTRERTHALAECMLSTLHSSVSSSVTRALTSFFSTPQDSEPVTALAISPDGRTVFSASRALLLRAWSAETGKVVQTYVGHKAPVAGIAVDPTGSLLATVSADHSTRVWDVAGGFCTHSFGGHR